MADKIGKSSYGAPKKKLIVRILILIVAALMLLGAILMPFMYAIGR